MEKTHTFMVPAYRESPFLCDCLRSLKAQTVESDIVITTSTPNEFLKKTAADFGVRLIINDAPPSIATDWQFALDQCQSQYVTLAHQDDVYYPTYTERLLERMEKSVIAFSDYEEIVEKDHRRDTPMLSIKRLLLWPFLFTRYLSRPKTKRLVLKFGSAICCPSVMYNREKMEGFRFDPAYEVSLDWDSWLRLTEAPGSFSYVNSVLMAHRIHADSETTKMIHSKRRYEEDYRMFSRLWSPSMARALSRFYARSTDSNRAGETGRGSE